MSGKPFDREVINSRERPLSSDVNEIGSYADLALRETLLNIYSSRLSVSSDSRSIQPPSGFLAFIGSAFKVRSATGMQVTLDAGLGFVNDNTPIASFGGIGGVDDLSLIKPLSLTATETISVPAADLSNPRWDIIEVQTDRRYTDATSRDIFNPSAAAFQPGVVNKTLSYNQNGRSTVNGIGSINYKTGTPASSPVAPAADIGYVPIARVFVPANSTQVGATACMDLRRMMFPGGHMRVAGTIKIGSAAASIGMLEAPPGVEVGAYLFNNQLTLVMKAGDSNQFRLDDAGNLAYGSIVANAAFSSGSFTFNTAGTPFTEIIGSTAASSLPTNPFVPLAIGQPFLNQTLGSISATSASGQISFEVNAQY